MIGTDESREAKIEETLRKMGVQSIGEVRAAKAKEDDQSATQKITSIFEVRALHFFTTRAVMLYLLP